LNSLFFKKVYDYYFKICPALPKADKDCVIKDFAAVSLIHEWIHTQQKALHPRDVATMEREAWKAEKDVACLLQNEVSKYLMGTTTKCSVGWVWEQIKWAITQSWADWLE
jgi:hypothetical protein